MVQGIKYKKVIGIVDYGMGNLRSVYNAFISLGADTKIIRSAQEMDNVTHLVIPGVGAFAKAMKNLRGKELEGPIKEFSKTGMPVLGICLGMQLMATEGFEIEHSTGLDLIKGSVRKLEAVADIRIPHVGWNSIELTEDHYLFEGIKKAVDFYFVHSFYFDAKHDENILAYCGYGMNFPAIVYDKNIVGIQFHPEKSQKNGLKILENFANN